MKEKHLNDLKNVHDAIETAIKNQPTKQTKQEFNIYSNMNELRGTIKIFLQEEKSRREKTNDAKFQIEDFDLT